MQSALKRLQVGQNVRDPVTMTFHPIREIGCKFYAALEGLWDGYPKRRETEDADPPRYLG